MKSFLYVMLLYLGLSILVVSCTSEVDPKPNCFEAEVVGPDCQSGWYILHLTAKEQISTEAVFMGQIQSGYVTTNNLPEAYQQTGSRIKVTLELNETESPVCAAVYMMYPPVKVRKICKVADSYK